LHSTTTHRFSRLHVAGERDQLQTLLAQTMHWTFWPSSVAIIFLLIVGRPLLSLFGDEFTAGYPLMFILSIGLLARAVVGPTEQLLNMLGEWRICACTYLVAFMSNLLLCAALIPLWSVAGAAIALSVALVLESILLFIMTKRRLIASCASSRLLSIGERAAKRSM
jgi:O-antigen/teichoic acid export membrane protein